MNQEKFKAIVKRLEQRRDAEGKKLAIHSLLIKEQENTYLHSFRSKQQISDIRSISKTVLSLVLGRIMYLSELGKYPAIHEETPILPIIQNKITLTNRANLEKLEKMKIKHLLTHTMGFDQVLMMRGDIANMDPFSYLNYVVNEPIVYDPGEYYLYSNAGFYLLSVVLEEFIQEDLTSFLKREFFNPLGIHEFTWEKYGNYLAGATRLWLLPEDLAKIGSLFLDEGLINGESFISNDWLEKMQTPHVKTLTLDSENKLFKRKFYGYGLWINNESFYFGYGTDGQRLILLPEVEKIIIVLAEQENTTQIDEEIDRLLLDTFKSFGV